MKRTIIAILLAIALLAAFSSCGNGPGTEPVTVATNTNDSTRVYVYLTVTLPDGTQTRQELNSAKSTLGEVLRDYGLIEYDENGIIVKVAGVEASWDNDNAYWAFFIGEDYAMHGPDDEILADGNEYEFRYTKG